MRPRFRLAIADVAAYSRASLSRWTHRVGVKRDMRCNATPTRIAIGLSSPVGTRPTVGTGEL